MPLVPRRTLLAVLSASALAVRTGGPAHAGSRPRPTAPPAGPVLAALSRAARPLRSVEPHGDLADLRPLGAAIGRSAVVGLGEAAHGARELFTLKHRVFRHLVEERGFTTFALEVNWAAGLRINDYVRHGVGEPRAIMAEEFADGKWPWNVREYLDLLTWMRAYNLRHPRRQVQFMGNDMAYPRIADTLFDRVLGYVAEHHPALRREFDRLYRELRAHADESDFQALPQRERRRLAHQARHAVALLAGLRPDGTRPAYAWTVQHARVVAQTATLLSHDLGDAAQIPEAMRYRDELMARNTAWWHRHTGHRVLLSAHDGHTAYETYSPAQYPVTQGAYLRKLLGRDYVGVGTTFGHGAAVFPDDDGVWRTERFGRPAPGSSEETLDRVADAVGGPAFLLDPRSAPAAAREWLEARRPTRYVGPPGDPYRPYGLARGHDLLVHVHRLRAARPLA
ncbi:erythromycin esterase family protein [Streptomyces sp. NPDC054784]